MHLNHSQRTILDILGDGHCHSGSELGQALDISRSAVWKQINQLIKLGCVINRIPQQGYQLPTPLTLLNEQDILAGLSPLSQSLNLHLFTEIDSTNYFLKNLPITNKLELCCAEQQTQGRGRFGRIWHSPFAENIYCSSRWQLDCDLAQLSGLSLVTSLAIISFLKSIIVTDDLKIKWPNDILWHDKKLCGNLIEIIAESNGRVQIIIGIGLNVNTDTVNSPLEDKPWCSLYEISGQYFNRNELISKLILTLKDYLAQFVSAGLGSFLDEWRQADYLYQKNIQVTQFSEIISGRALGINDTGQLILEDNSGKKHMLSSGDTSLHLNKD